MGEFVKVVRWVSAFFVAAVFFNVAGGIAAEPLDEKKQLFYTQFRYAVQAHDATRLIRLTHPKSLACMPEEDREYYYSRILDNLVHVFGKRQAVLRVSGKEFSPGEIDIERDLASGEHVIWPVTPEAIIFLKYEHLGSKAVASIYLAKDENDWKWIHVCSDK